MLEVEEVYLPKIYPPLINGKVTGKSISNCMRSIKSLSAQLSLQAGKFPDEHRAEIDAAIDQINAISDNISSFATSVFDTIKNPEHEGVYQAREFVKDAEIFFQKKIVEAVTTITGLIGGGLESMLKIPLPVVGEFSPLDIFTKEGKENIKKKLKELETLLSTDKVTDTLFQGKWNLYIPEYSAEECYHKVMDFGVQMLNDFVIAGTNALVSFLESIPVIGSVISSLGAIKDPTKAIQESVEQGILNIQKQYEEMRDKFMSGELAENTANDLLNGATDMLENLSLPFLGSVGGFVDLSDEKKKVLMKEFDLARLKDSFDHLIQKIRRIIAGGWNKMIYDILLSAPDWVLKQFPILKDIIKALETIVDVCEGKIPMEVALNAVCAPMFDISIDIIMGCFNSSVATKETEYGIEPGGVITELLPFTGMEEVGDDEAAGSVIATNQPAPANGTTEMDDDELVSYDDQYISITDVEYDDGTMTTYRELDKATQTLYQVALTYGTYKGEPSVVEVIKTVIP